MTKIEKLREVNRTIREIIAECETNLFVQDNNFNFNLLNESVGDKTPKK